MRIQLCGLRSGAFGSLLFFVAVTALGIGYILGAQRTGAPLIQPVTRVISVTVTPTIAASGIGSNPNLAPASKVVVSATNDTIGDCLGVVQARSASLTTGPSATYTTVGIVYQNNSLQLVGRTASNTWFKVQDVGESWIRADLITVAAGCILPEVEPSAANPGSP